MKRILPSLVVIATTLLAPSVAHAWLLRVDFSVLADPLDPVRSGEAADGYFTFDSSLIPTGGGSVWGPNPPGDPPYTHILGLIAPSLSFEWDGVAWSRENADLFTLHFLPDESLFAWGIGGEPLYVVNDNGTFGARN